jgi:hypothetical protein
MFLVSVYCQYIEIGEKVAMNELESDGEPGAEPLVRTDPYRYMTVQHHFIGGIYTKECHLPPGLRFEQHRHSFDHVSVLASGTAIVEVDGEPEEHTGPKVLLIKARAIHAITPLTPCVWLCQHVSACTDPEDIDVEFIARDK